MKSTGVYLEEYYGSFLHYYFLKKDIDGFAKTTKEAIDSLDSYEVYDRWVGMERIYGYRYNSVTLKSSKDQSKNGIIILTLLRKGFSLDNFT